MCGWIRVGQRVSERESMLRGGVCIERRYFRVHGEVVFGIFMRESMLRGGVCIERTYFRVHGEVVLGISPTSKGFPCTTGSTSPCISAMWPSRDCPPTPSAPRSIFSLAARGDPPVRYIGGGGGG